MPKMPVRMTRLQDYYCKQVLLYICKKDLEIKVFRAKDKKEKNTKIWLPNKMIVFKKIHVKIIVIYSITECAQNVHEKRKQKVFKISANTLLSNLIRIV